MTHWATKYIGQRWKKGTHDCWAFCRKVEREQFGIEIPDIEIDSNNILAVVRHLNGNQEKNNWVEVTDLQEGDVLYMSMGNQPHHVGIYVQIDGGGVLHCIEGAGVIFTKLADIAAMSYNIIAIYRHKSVALWKPQ